MNASPKLRPTHERRDVPLGVVAFLAMLVAVGIALWAGIVLGFYRGRVLHPPRVSAPAIPPPKLQIDEPRDLARFRAAEERRLNSYGWVDRAAGIAHIPIDAAMRHVATSGIPDWPKTAP